MTTWPDKVTIADKVGAHRCRYVNGKPCCTLGWAEDDGLLCTPWIAAYHRVAATFLDTDQQTYVMVADTNDYLLSTDHDRALVYNATNAYLGYVVGQSADVLALTRRTRKRFGKPEISE